MELVVKIDDDTYKDIKKGKVYTSFRDVPQEAVLAIANGTPLPKGHGRLGDLDAVMDDINRSIEAMTNIGIMVDGEYLWGKLNDAIYNAPTIIEADKEVQDADSD